MITVEFHGYSDDNQHIEETRIKVENSFFLSTQIQSVKQ